MLRAQRLWLLLLSMVVSGCGSYCAPIRDIRDRVDDSVVVGAWRLTDESLRNLERDGFRRDPSHRYTITFNADHSCAFASVIQFDGVEYDEAPCTWSLAHDVELSYGSVANLLRFEISRKGTPLSTSLSFAREDGVLILWEYYGDPDQWDFLEYTRVRAQ